MTNKDYTEEVAKTLMNAVRVRGEKRQGERDEIGQMRKKLLKMRKKDRIKRKKKAEVHIQEIRVARVRRRRYEDEHIFKNCINLFNSYLKIKRK